LLNLISYLIKIIKIIAIIIAIFFVYFIVINWGDEELKLEVKQALAWQPPANAFDDNGFLVLWGIEAPIELNAAEVGKKTLQAELARFAIMQKTHKEPPPFNQNPAEIDDFIDWKDNQCDYQKQQNCVDFYLQQGADKLAFVLLVQERLATRFDAIQQSKNYVEVMPPMIAAGLPKYSLLMQASELERIRAISNIAENRMDIGLQGIVKNALFSRRLLEKSNSLISHMFALAMMQRDTRILSELMTKYPNIATQYSEQLALILAPISAPEYNLKKAFLQECVMMYQVFDSLKYATASDFAVTKSIDGEIGGSNFLKSKILKIGYSANATNNAALTHCNSRIKIAESDAQSLDAAKKEDLKAAEATRNVVNARLLTQKNPVGRILPGIAEPDFTSYIERQHDLDGYLKLVRTQLDVMADGVEKEKIVAIEIHDPYTQKLMPFDVKTGVVTFTGRQPSSANFNKSNIYQVKMY
jgi:hypothetical protein